VIAPATFLPGAPEAQPALLNQPAVTGTGTTG